MATTPSCTHTPLCPPASSPDREAARVISSHPEQGWSLLCNGSLVFEDTGELLPDGRIIAPHRPTDTSVAENSGGESAAPQLVHFAGTHALLGGTSRSGKTSAAAAAHRYAALATQHERADVPADHPSV